MSQTKNTECQTATPHRNERFAVHPPESPLPSFSIKSYRQGERCPRWVLRKQCSENCWCQRYAHGLADHPAQMIGENGSRNIVWNPYPGAVDLQALAEVERYAEADGIRVSVWPNSLYLPGGTLGIYFHAA